MDPLTNAPVPYAAFSMPPNIMDYHPVSTNGSGLPIRVGGGSSSGGGGGVPGAPGGPLPRQQSQGGGHRSGVAGSGPPQPSSSGAQTSGGATGQPIGFSEEDLAMMDHIVRQHQRSAMVQGQGSSHYRG